MNEIARPKLRRLLDHARVATTHYAALLQPPSEPIPVDPLDWLRALPVLTRRNVQQDRARLMSSVGDSSTWRVVRTTGTTGEPVEVVLDDAALRAEADALARHLDRSLSTLAWRERNVIHVALHAGATSRAGPSPWSDRGQHIKWNLIRAWQADDETFLSCLAHLDGHVVTTMPSVAELLGGRVMSLGAAGRICPLIVVLSGEVIEPRARIASAEALWSPVSSMYTLAEVGVAGTECPDTLAYHVEEKAVFLEVIDPEGVPAGPGIEGDILITPLDNLAMPLLRYATGDRGTWATDPCRCGRSSPLLLLSQARRPTRLVTASGGAVNVVRFAKVLAGLEVERVNVAQVENGSVEIMYEATRPLGGPATALLTGTVRSALGPAAAVSVRRVPSRADKASGDSEQGFVATRTTAAEPDGPSPTEVASWLRGLLEGRPGLEAAVVTGSCLDPAATTRFSDIDVSLMVEDDPLAATWVDLARELRSTLPGLAVNVDRLEGLSLRAPLVAARLLSEQLPIVGHVGPNTLAWPTAVALEAEGAFWAQGASAALWHALTEPRPGPLDPVREAWVASKLALTALRYHYLSRGVRETAARAVLSMAEAKEGPNWPWLSGVLDGFDVAREHRPPPPDTLAAMRFHVAAAMSCIAATV